MSDRRQAQRLWSRPERDVRSPDWVFRDRDKVALLFERRPKDTLNARTSRSSYGWQFALIPPDWPLSRALRQSPDWILRDQDKVALLFERRPKDVHSFTPVVP